MYFANKKNEYQNLKQENPFLLALASGRFQLEELARRHYPNGILIEDEKNNGSYDYDKKVFETNELLKRENVVIFETSNFIRNKYSQPTNKINVTSSNFPNEKIWLSLKDGHIIDPYTTLKPIASVFDVDLEFIDQNEEISDGNLAMVAYGKTQYTDMSEHERNAIKKSLLKYCELDTLAVVMAFEYLSEEVK